MSRARARCWPRSRPRCRPTSRCSPPPSPTGAPQAAAAEKIKKDGERLPALALVENPDILATVARRRSGRPPLVVGFAAETEKVVEHARAKLATKGCDLIVANDVAPGTGVMGGDEQHGPPRHAATGSRPGRPSTRTRSRARLVARIARRGWDGAGRLVSAVRCRRLPHADGLPLPRYRDRRAPPASTSSRPSRRMRRSLIEPLGRALVPTGLVLRAAGRL